MQDGEYIAPLLPEGEVVFPCLYRLNLPQGLRADEEGGDCTDYKQPDDDCHIYY